MDARFWELDFNKDNVYDKFLALYEQGIDIGSDSKSQKHYLISMACIHGNFEILKLLFNDERTVFDEEIQSLLSAAINYNFFDIASFLVDSGKFETTAFNNAMLSACRNNSIDGVGFFLNIPHFDPSFDSNICIEHCQKNEFDELFQALLSNPYVIRHSFVNEGGFHSDDTVLAAKKSNPELFC